MTELERVTLRVIGCARSTTATVTACCGKMTASRESDKNLSNSLTTFRESELSSTPSGLQPAEEQPGPGGGEKSGAKREGAER